MEIQETRRFILEILKDHKECTVEEIVSALAERLNRDITTVTVRHHLERLRADNLVNAPEIRRRNTPGRPQYIYSLAPQAYEVFPNNYAGLAQGLLTQLKSHVPPKAVNVILEGMADDLADQAGIPAGLPLEKRLQFTVDYLNKQGYVAHYESTPDGFILSTTNCPYEKVAGSHEEPCHFDLRLVASLIGVVPRFVGSVREGSSACEYFIPSEEANAQA